MTTDNKDFRDAEVEQLRILLQEALDENASLKMKLMRQGERDSLIAKDSKDQSGTQRTIDGSKALYDRSGVGENGD